MHSTSMENVTISLYVNFEFPIRFLKAYFCNTYKAFVKAAYYGDFSKVNFHLTSFFHKESLISIDLKLLKFSLIITFEISLLEKNLINASFRE